MAEVCCNKICELSVVRALCRPLKADEKRSGVATKSKALVTALDGVLPPQLAMVAVT